MRVLCLGSMIILFWPPSMYLITFWQINDNFGYWMILVRTIGMLIPLVYCFPLCLSNLSFFVKKKFYRDGDYLSFSTLVVLIWVFVLWCTKLMHGLAHAIIVSLQLIINVDR